MATDRNPKRLSAQPSMPRVWLPFQQPRLVEVPPSGADWVHEIKFDGYRLQAHVHAGAVTLFTRNGHDWTAKFPDLAGDLAGFDDSILDGELCALDARGQPEFSELVASIASGRTGGLVMFVFDILWGQGEDLRPYTWLRRQAALEAVLALNASRRIRKVESFAQDGRTVLHSVAGLGLEGVVSKQVNSRYLAGKGLTWCKTKLRASAELVVGGWKQEPHRPFKGLLVGVYEEGRLRYAGSIQTGFSGSSDLRARLGALESDRSPFTAGEPPRKTSEIHWVRPELVVAAEIAEWTAKGKLRQASFKGLREDKRPEEVVRERPDDL